MASGTGSRSARDRSAQGRVALLLAPCGEALAQGGPAGFLHALLGPIAGEIPGRPDAAGLLTERELQILALIAEGLSNQAIADRLIRSLGTIKAHSSSIYSKLGAGNRTEAVARARELELI